MKKISMIILCLSIASTLFSQINFTINGKIALLSKAEQIKLGCSGGQFTAKINQDGSFILKGKVPEASIGLISTDSSGADAIWLEEGNYQMACKEVRIDNDKNIYFRTPQLKGPLDAEIYNVYTEPMYYFSTISPGESREKKFKDHAINFLDSLLNNFPQSKIIPEILRISKPLIGDEATQLYIPMLNDNQLKSPGYNQLNNYFKRNQKIEKEVYFTDFQMKDQNGNIFKLSSVNKNKKLILLDFWSSDCIPCRRKHTGLVELYKKYSEKGFEIISISLDVTDEDWKKAILKDNMIWINVSELRGWYTSLAEDYFIESIPFSIWLDKDKKIVSVTGLSEKQIEEYLK